MCEITVRSWYVGATSDVQLDLIVLQASDTVVKVQVLVLYH